MSFMGVKWKTIYFHTRQDCDVVVSILARNGYTVTVHEIENSLTVSANPYCWRLSYCESSEVFGDFENEES